MSKSTAIKKLIQKVELEDIDIPSMPHVAAKVLEVIEDAHFSLKHLGNVMHQDQSLTANFLKIANTSFYNRGKPITTIHGAVMAIGIQNLATLIAFVALSNYAKSKHINKELLQHPNAVSTLTALLAAATEGIKREEALIAGLLHDVGLLLLFDNAPAIYAEIESTTKEGNHSFVQVEREMLGFDHCQIGSILAEKWRFPAIYAYTIQHHHDEEIATGDLNYTQRLCYLVRIADHIAFEASVGIGESGEKNLAALLAVLGIENNVYENAVEKAIVFRETGLWR